MSAGTGERVFRRRREPGPASVHVNMANVLTRLDAAVDRLEGVYEQLVPALEHAKRREPPAPPEGEPDA